MSQVPADDSDFDWLANVYNSHGAFNHPSELHGLVLGTLSGGLRWSDDEWLQQIVEHMGVEKLDVERQAHLQEDLIEYYSATDQELEQDSGTFALLLPDDDFPLHERAEALSFWVRGFLEGIAIAANAKLVEINPDLQEILRDFVAISQLDARVESSETGEKELFEVSEYVRVGVLNLYAEFNAPAMPSEATSSEKKPTLH